jgi:hypothetical protein
MTDEQQRVVEYPGGHPDTAMTTWSLVYGAALTLTGQDNARALAGGYLDPRTALLSAAAWLDARQLAYPDAYGRPDLAREAHHAAQLLWDWDQAHNTALAFHGNGAPDFPDHLLSDLPPAEDWSEVHPALRYLRREWAAYRDLDAW